MSSEHEWKAGDRVRALCDVGDYIRKGDVGTVAVVGNSNVLWCKWENPITPELDEYGWCIRSDEVTTADAAIAALSAPQPPAEAQGDGEASEGWHAALDSASELVSNAPDARYRKRAEQVRDWIKAHPAEAQAQGGGEVGYEFEVWQEDSLQAGGSTSDYATAKSEADHYALMYGQDGPAEVRMYEKRRITAPPSAPVGVERLRRMVEKLAAHVRPTCCELWEEAQATLSQQPAAVDEMAELVGLLDEVRSHFTRDDDLPDDLLPRIDAALRDHDQEGKDGLR